MNNWMERVEALDLSLFEAIDSQTSAADRKSLLGVQRATARRKKEYTYLEIGSHLGGSIQPHLLDERCKKIYSLDPRPAQQPDDRSSGYVAYYENNSSERMLALLRGLMPEGIAKIACIDLDASQVDVARIRTAPDLIFIDGEHTQRAVLSDFQFCGKVVEKNGAILFHDFYMIYPGIVEICRALDRQGRCYLPLKLDGCVFGIFFDPETVHADPYLAALYRTNRHFLPQLRFKRWLKQFLPDSVLRAVRAVRNWNRKGVEEAQAAH